MGSLFFLINNSRLRHFQTENLFSSKSWPAAISGDTYPSVVYESPITLLHAFSLSDVRHCNTKNIYYALLLVYESFHILLQPPMITSLDRSTVRVETGI